MFLFLLRSQDHSCSWPQRKCTVGYNSCNAWCHNSQLLYASLAWWGYLKADERNRLQSIIAKAVRYGYLPRSFSTLDELREDSNEKLFLLLACYVPNVAKEEL